MGKGVDGGTTSVHRCFRVCVAVVGVCVCLFINSVTFRNNSAISVFPTFIAHVYRCLPLRLPRSIRMSLSFYPVSLVCLVVSFPSVVFSLFLFGFVSLSSSIFVVRPCFLCPSVSVDPYLVRHVVV